MEPYKEMYLMLFRAITEALNHMAPASSASEILRQAQQQAEELYIEAGEKTEK